MFRKIPFVKNELNPGVELPGMFGRPSTILRTTPVTSRENTQALYYDKHPFWLPLSNEVRMFHSPMYSVQLGRGRSADSTDAFGIEWEFVPTVGGSIVRPGSPFMEDVNEWKDKVHFPDIDSWDWEGEAKATELDPRFSHEMSFVNGFWFERLISFMDFMPAALALIDEDQQDAILELFQATTDFACKLVDKYCEYFPMLDLFNVHDDWGAQKAPFFSDEIAYKLFVPFMKQLTDHIHSKGRRATLHSCGHTATRVQCYIDGGFDMWAPQTMNDIHWLHENYGDKIILAVWPDAFDPETTSEADQRRLAREFVDCYCKPGKPVVFSHTATWALTPAFSEEMYEYSRKKYLG